MGFGLMLIGYLAATLMSYSFVPGFIGYALMMWGSIKLSDYDIKFKRCIVPLMPASVLSIYLYANKMCGYFNLQLAIFPKSVINSVTIIENTLSVCTIVLLMIAINSIAQSTGLDKLSFRALRNMIILVASETVYMVALCLPAGEVANGMAYISLLVRLLRIVLDLMLLFSCYRMICNEGDEEMPAKEVKIPILRKMEEVLNKRDANAFDDARSYKEKRLEKKKNKKK